MILVTGGTGFVGKEIVRQLAEAGHHVRVLARHPERAGKGPISGRPLQNVEYVRGDVLDSVSLASAMKGATAVIHLVGILFETPWVSYRQAHVDATKNVLEAARAAGVKRYLHMSALGSRPQAKALYHQTKWEAEELVRKSGLDWTILRPSLIYGPDAKAFSLLAAFFRWPVDFLNFYTFPNMGGGKTLVQPVALEEAAQTFVRALSNSIAIGKTYDLCGEKPLSWTDVLVRIGRKEGVEVELDPHLMLFTLRCILWSLFMAVPFAALLGASFHLLHERVLILLIAAEVALFFGVRYWTRYLLYTVSWTVPNFLARLADYLPWTWMHFGELFKLMQEDNVGDPVPVHRDLHFK
jgi:NADH dehydrogenase